jgi:hypothetical protein
MATKNQIEANRRNALRSTGPKSAAGKVRSSQNALKHGGYAKALLTPDELDVDFTQWKNIFFARYSPQNEFDQYEVESLAALAWRLRRFGRMEAEILSIHGYEPQDQVGSAEQDHYAGAGWGFTHDSSKARSVLALSQVEDKTYRHYLTVKKQLEGRLSGSTGCDGRLGRT